MAAVDRFAVDGIEGGPYNLTVNLFKPSVLGSRDVRDAAQQFLTDAHPEHVKQVVYNVRALLELVAAIDPRWIDDRDRLAVDAAARMVSAFALR